MVMRIQEIRKERGIQQTVLAEQMGVSQSVISEWEKEVYLPKARQLPALAVALGCTINDLFVPIHSIPQTFAEVHAG